MKKLSRHQAAAICAVLLLWLLLATLPARRVASSPPAPPPPPTASGAPAPVYRARGSGSMAVDGPGCCDGVTFPGTFEMDYEVDEAAGRVSITRLYAALADVDITFRFLIFETGRVQVRCGVARSESPIVGSADAFGNLTVAAGAATLSGEAFDRREAGGECGGGSSSVTLTNNAPLTGLLDPASNRLSISGVFTTVTEGHAYDVRLDMSGEYVNRPPVAVFGVEGPGLGAFAQGGCPAVWNSGNPPEPTVEANDPAGLKMYLRSFSHDPDGAWRGSDLLLDQWRHGRDSGPEKFIGESRRLGPLSFEFGPVHHLRLETTDRLGATSVSTCGFRVVDRTPPAVTAPAPKEVPASVKGGATPATSDALKKFLKGAFVVDIVDPWPSPLPPLLNGKEVTDNTLFPTGDWLTVTFRYVDKSGNVGSSKSSVRVYAPQK
ncbi:MAG TPA: hypothetical protein VF668_01560 [Pyrinomonadaceae bacterium]